MGTKLAADSVSAPSHFFVVQIDSDGATLSYRDVLGANLRLSRQDVEQRMNNLRRRGLDADAEEAALTEMNERAEAHDRA